MEQTSRTGKTFQAGHVVNNAAETEENQSSNDGSGMRLEADGAAVGEYFFQNRCVRTIATGGQTWFVVADVCEILEHGNPTRAVARLEPSERALTTIQGPAGSPQTVNVVNESGLFALALTSRKPQAIAFRLWVTGEVLPAIRRTGFYSVNGSQDDVITLARLDIPVRYVVIAIPGQPPHVRQTQPDAIHAERTSLDCEGLCYALKAIEVWWHKVQQRSSLGGDPTGGFAPARLERAIFDGAWTADQYLQVNQNESPI